jgi:hypothetical protein
MMQQKIPKTGATLKTTQGDVWFSPQRDIGHALPQYVLQAFAILDRPESPLASWYLGQGGSDEELSALGRFLARYIRMSAEARPETRIADLFKEAGYGELSLRCRLAFGHAMLNVVLSSYFVGVREAKVGHPLPEEPVPWMTAATPRGRMSWWRRGVRWLARRILVVMAAIARKV